MKRYLILPLGDIETISFFEANAPPGERRELPRHHAR